MEDEIKRQRSKVKKIKKMGGGLKVCEKS